MISHQKIAKDLKGIIADVACVAISSVRNSTDLQEDLGIDSFNAAEILVAVENKYKIAVDPACVFNLRYFKDVVELVETYLKNKSR